MSNAKRDEPAETPSPVGVTDEDILADLASSHATVLCPLHGVAPRFDKDASGALVETFCCEALAQIFLELRGGDVAPPAPG